MIPPSVREKMLEACLARQRETKLAEATGPPVNVMQPLNEPSTQPEAAEPSVTKPSEQPSLTKPSEEPSVTKLSEQPSVSKLSEQPSLTKPSEEPSVTKLSEQPSLTKPSEQPSLTERFDQPTLTEHSKEQDLSKHPEELVMSQPYDPSFTQREQNLVKSLEPPKPAMPPSVVFNFFGLGAGASSDSPFNALMPFFQGLGLPVPPPSAQTSGQASLETRHSKIVEVVDSPVPSPVLVDTPAQLPEPAAANVESSVDPGWQDEAAAVVDLTTPKNSPVRAPSPDFNYLMDFDDDEDVAIDDADEPDFLPPRAMGPILPPPARPKRSLLLRGRGASNVAPQSSKYSSSDLGALLARFRTTSSAPGCALQAHVASLNTASSSTISTSSASSSLASSSSASSSSVSSPNWFQTGPAAPPPVSLLTPPVVPAPVPAPVPGPDVSPAEPVGANVPEAANPDIPPGYCCPVCLSGRFEVILRCKHMFCTACIRRMMQTRPSKCAMCQRNFRKYEKVFT